ncbi:uncharacterized protein EV154DRAFT_480031 [Mucor mucedo]|uniref:uncharacterized protein n=1 Tax=Mucor mucedo TaxID=29922 RepID=UPI00221F44F7|nr:uncharacterized protein EV154DRAFT_480031 [Mucor mucedo]KAI7892763.1 hypothetical protein EV154DRAFT_480031 [Mucor mucedo]
MSSENLQDVQLIKSVFHLSVSLSDSTDQSTTDQLSVGTNNADMENTSAPPQELPSFYQLASSAFMSARVKLSPLGLLARPLAIKPKHGLLAQLQHGLESPRIYRGCGMMALELNLECSTQRHLILEIDIVFFKCSKISNTRYMSNRNSL